MTPKVLLEEFFRLRLDRSSAKSPTGKQLEGLRDETTAIRGSNVHAIEYQHMRYAMMVKIWSSLSREEQAVLFLQIAPLGPVEYVNAYRAVWPDEMQEGDDPISLCGPKVVLQAMEIKPRTYLEISKFLGLSVSQILTRVKSSNQKILNHPLYRSFERD